MNSGKKTLLLCLFGLMLLAGCRKNQYKINVSDIDVQIEIKRLEKDLFSLDPEDVKGSIPSLSEKYGSFFRLFGYVINAGELEDPDFADILVSFCTDRLNVEVYNLTQRTFPEITGMENEFEVAFNHYKFYFPERQVPYIYTCITGFNNSVIVGDSVLAIGLDRYLGAGTEYYKRLGIYDYISARMNPENIVPDCMFGWADSEFVFDSIGYKDDNLLTRMIHEGKLKYFEKCMLPEHSDELIFGFTSAQMNFCRNNEDQMWTYIVENDFLFNTDQFQIRKFIGEAPFTSYFTNESPGRAAIWVGFRIIEQYMKKNQNVTLADLMKKSDVQDILEGAKYHPAK